MLSKYRKSQVIDCNESEFVMKVFIIGATGFVGKEVENLLCKKWHSIVALIRDAQREDIFGDQ